MSDQTTVFVARSIELERQLLRQAADCREIASGRNPERWGTRPDAAASAASLVDEMYDGVREVTQARTIVRRLDGAPAATISRALCAAGLPDYADAFLSGEWEVCGLF